MAKVGLTNIDIAIQAEHIGKCYQIYEKPVDRLKQSFWRGRKRLYKEFWALREVSLHINKGETVGIIGSNGSGKSTLLQIICGILNPSEGELTVQGRISALLELGAGFNPEFTGRDNVYMNAALMGLSYKDVDLCYNDIIAFADIGEFIDQPVKTYSSGMYVRLAFATAINVSPDILIVDEALAVGDIRFQQKCMARIKDFCRKGTVIFVSHNSAAVIELCTRVIWIEKGRIRMEGLPKHVVEKYLEYMYEGDTGKEAGSNICLDKGASNDTTGFIPVGTHIRQFGSRSVTISAVSLRCQGVDNGVVYTGRQCEIGMVLNVHEDILRPITGYIVKDHLGREVLGDNTAFMKRDLPPFSKGKSYMMAFKIDFWPNLCEGDYTLSVAVSDGILEDHMVCHWLHDVIVFRSIHITRPHGVFSIPGTDVIFQDLV